MNAIFARRALLETGWAHDVRVELAGTMVSSVARDGKAKDGDVVVDTLLPALANLHSHSFQRAMAGMTEVRAAGEDSFWTWRTLMYRFLEHLTPEQIEAIAAQVFVEMQEAGFAAVGEFHYLHHQPGGAPYDALAELSQRIVAAASATGIGLTLLPVLYSYGSAGGAPLAGGQLRFGNDPERFADLVEEARAAARDTLSEDARVGIAPHSLRATVPDELARVIADHGGGPVHIHVAEQTREVDEIAAWLGARPVAWLLDNVAVDGDWCLIHATHMTAGETAAMARSGAVAGLCPITEANLGDGIFNGAGYLAAGGAFGVGSDSNVRISLAQELSLLEYSQRLRDRARNVLAPGGGSVGERLYLGAAAGGAKALGRNAGAIGEGRLADLVAIDSSAATLCALTREQLLDGWLFASGDEVVSDLWSAGRHCVRGGRHVVRDEVEAGYRRAVGELVAAL